MGKSNPKIITKKFKIFAEKRSFYQSLDIWIFRLLDLIALYLLLNKENMNSCTLQLSYFNTLIRVSIKKAPCTMQGASVFSKSNLSISRSLQLLIHE